MKSVLEGAAAAVFYAWFCALPASAQAPPGYYDAVDSSNAATLRASLHGVIDDHQRFPYTSSATDTWNILELADEDPLDNTSIRDVYLNASYPKAGGGNANYNREHTWPKSYGFPNDGSSNYPYSDCHQLYLCDSGYNSSRSNKPFRFCSNGCNEKVTELNGGVGGGYITPPEAPIGLGAALGAGTVELDWLDNTEIDLAGYHVYRAEGASGAWVRQTTSIVGSSAWSDTAILSSTTYFYAVSALDTAGNESGLSLDVQIITDGGGGPIASDPWINELHYDNSGLDTGEFVEVAGPAGLDLLGWRLVFYNGNSGLEYQTINMSGVFADQGGCVGALAFAMQGIQNGSPDGIALVDPAGVVLSFLSYEGSMVAGDGPAAGQTSVDMGVGESGATPAGTSLQLVGIGADPASFSWTGGSPETPGLPNNGQVFDGGCGGTNPPQAPSGFSAEAGDSRILLTWLPNSEPDLAGYNLYRSNTAGSGHILVNTNLITGESYLDMGVVNGVTVHYFLTALNTNGEESDASQEVSVTPQDITAPAVPTGLSGIAGNGVVDLTWDANSENDLAGYILSRSEQTGGPYVPLFGGLTVSTSWSDATVVNGVVYFYVLQAQDTWGNTSAYGSEVSAAPQTNGSGPGQPVVLTHDDFESGFGNWDSGGEDCKLYTDGRLAWQGFAALNLQDNSGLASSSTLVQPIDVLTPGYSSIEVDFHFIALGMEKGEGFMLQFFDGSSWVTVQTWARGREFENKQWQHETVVILSSFVNFSRNMKLRLRCDASGDDDDVYIDALTVTAQ